MSENKPFTLGLFGTLTIIGALLIFLWLLTFKDPETLFALMTSSFFLVGGLALSFFMAGVRLEPFNMTAFMQSILIMVLNVAVIFFVNTLVPMRFEIGIIDARFLGALVGIAEECFFRLFLAGMIYRFTRSFFIAVVGSSAIWTGYHIARYGGNPNIMVIVFICGCILGATYLYTRSADGSIFAHGLVNYIALA